MPLYELVYLCRTASPLPSIAATMKQKAEAIYNAGGVVRRLENMGIMALAYPMYRHREKHYKGRWIYMLFDSSTETANKIKGMVAQDTNIFRFALYRQKDEFRDTYDENYFNFGTPKGEAQDSVNQQRVKSYLKRLEQVNGFSSKALYPKASGLEKSAPIVTLDSVLDEEAPTIAQQITEDFDDCDDENMYLCERNKLEVAQNEMITNNELNVAKNYQAAGSIAEELRAKLKKE